jgi:hypothetical protein
VAVTDGTANRTRQQLLDPDCVNVNAGHDLGTIAW